MISSHVSRPGSPVAPRALILGLALLLSVRCSAKEMSVSGRVFEDRNKNGIYDEGEHGIAGVYVTDSMQFAKTGGDGRYALDAVIDEGLIDERRLPLINVRWPQNYWPTSAYFIDLADVKDAGNVDFALGKQVQASPFHFVHVTDLHIPWCGEQAYREFKDEISRVLPEPPKFCLVTGDLVSKADEAGPELAERWFKDFAEYNKDFPLPILFTSGNHDPAGVNKQELWDKQDPRYGYGLYFKYGAGPLRWSFDYAGTHFVGLDYTAPYGDNQDKWGQWITQTALDWLRKDIGLCPPAQQKLLFVHSASDDPRVASLCNELGIRRIFIGHSHVAGIRDWTVGDLGPVQVFSGGSLHAASVLRYLDRKVGYRVLRLAGERLDQAFKYVGDPVSIVLEHPRFHLPFLQGDDLRGSFFDVQGKIKTLTVRFGSFSQTVPFVRLENFCRFRATPDLSTVANGFRKVEVVVSDGEEEWAYSREFLLLGGKDPGFAAEEDAELVIRTHGVSEGADVEFNGHPICRLRPMKYTSDNVFDEFVYDEFTCTIPAEKVLGLNTVTFRPSVYTRGNNKGKPDSFKVIDVVIRYKGQSFYDRRADDYVLDDEIWQAHSSQEGANWRRKPVIKDKEYSFYVDLL